MQSVVYAAESKQLLSGGDDAVVMFWNVDVKREEVCNATLFLLHFLLHCDQRSAELIGCLSQ